MLAQFPQALTQRRVLAGAIARLKIGKALDDPDGRVLRHRLVCKLQQPRQRDRRAMYLWRRNIVVFILKLIALPDKDDTRMRTKHRLKRSQTGLCFRGTVSILAGSAARAIRRPQRPQDKGEAQRQRTARNDQGDVFCSHPLPSPLSNRPRRNA